MDHAAFIVCSFTENAIGLKRVKVSLYERAVMLIEENCISNDCT